MGSDTLSPHVERLKALEEAVVAIKRTRESMKDLSCRLQAEIKAVRRRASRSIIEQRLRYHVPVTAPLMLCSQIQRSGGTLVARLFDGHPECFAHPFELKWGRPRKWHWPKLPPATEVAADELFARVTEHWPSKFAEVGFRKYSRAQRNDGGDVTYPFIFDLDVQRGIFASTLSRYASPSQRDILNAYLTSLFNGWLDYQNLYAGPKKWVTAFVPKLVMAPGAVSDFFTDYPDGLLVTIVRDPRAWLSSVMRHLDEPDAERVLDGWIASADASIVAQEKHPDRVVVVLFEDLVHRTEAVMRTLCDRMGMAFSDVLLEPTYNSMPVLSDSSYVPAIRIDVQVTERYRDVLSTEQMQIVARKALPRFLGIQQRFGVQSHA